MKRYKTVPEYLEAHAEWRSVLDRLRAVMTESELEETVKWGAPCYTFQGKNLIGLAAFKDFVSIWFHQGALLHDDRGVLVNAQEGRTKALRQWRIRTEDEIDERLLRSYVEESIENQRQGREIKADRNKPVEIPDELASVLAENADLRERFDALSPGKRRAFAEHVAEAKREETRIRRLEKILPMIQAGQGLHDKYR